MTIDHFSRMQPPQWPTKPVNQGPSSSIFPLPAETHCVMTNPAFFMHNPTLMNARTLITLMNARAYNTSLHMQARTRYAQPTARATQTSSLTR